MEKQTLCPTILIEDTPSAVDAFASEDGPGPYQRVANAIADMIGSAEPGGKVVGLEGGWGAGKSTVVNLLQERLRERDDKYAVIAFDAWAHEGDPLRRTYLETLIKDLQERKWVDSDKWDHVLDKLANRRREESTQIVPKPTSLGVLLAMSLIPVPLGAALVSGAVEKGVTFGWGLDPHWGVILGTALSLSPFSILLSRMIWLLINHKPIFNAAEWAFLEGHSVTKTNTVTVETPNPTSIEFEQHFNSLMQEGLQKHKERQIVLVLDNLDRIDPSGALQIWSTLQTFLQHRLRDRAPWFRQLWVVVPYDPNGLRRLWDNRTQRVESTSDDEPPEAIEDKSRVASESFLDKSFQIRFQVPSPVLSDWQTYLCGLIERALPDHGEKDRHLIYRVFDLCRPNTGESPTPRRLKLFVNQIGAIHRQWQDTYPIAHVAYYVCQCQSRTQVTAGLLSGTLPEERVARLLGPSLRDNLAGLSFNVDAALGQQMLLSTPIYDALAQGNSDVLKGLEKRHRDGFWVVLEAVVSTKFDGADGPTVARFGKCLQGSGLLKGRSTNAAKTALDALRHTAMSVKQWRPFDEEMAEGISALCEAQADRDFSTALLKAVARTLARKVGDSKEKAADANVLAGGILKVLRTIESLGHADATQKPIQLPVDDSGWIAVCDELLALDPEGGFWRLLRPNVHFKAISSFLQEAVTSGQFDERHRRTIIVTHATSLQSEWGEVLGAIQQRLNASHNIEPEEAYCLIKVLCDLRAAGSGEAKAALLAFSESGHIMHHFHRARSEGKHDCMSLCCFCSLDHRPNMAKPAAVGNADAGYAQYSHLVGSDDEEVGQRLVALLKEYGEQALLFKVADRRKGLDPLIRLCFRLVADGEDPEWLFTPNVILERWKWLRDELPDNTSPDRFNALVGHLTTTTDLCSMLMGLGEEYVSEEAGLVLAVVVNTKTTPKGFLEWAKRGLESMNRQAWQHNLEDEYAAVQLMLALSERSIAVHLGTAYQDALIDHATVAVSDGKLPPEDLRYQWGKALEPLGVTGPRKVLRERLVDIVVGEEGSVSEAFFEMYGAEITDRHTLIANDRVVSHFFTPIVRERSVHGLHWLHDFFHENRDFLESFPTEHAVEDFHNRLQEYAASEQEDESQEIIADIVSLLGLHKIQVGSEGAQEEVEVAVDEAKDEQGEGKV